WMRVAIRAVYFCTQGAMGRDWRAVVMMVYEIGIGLDRLAGSRMSETRRIFIGLWSCMRTRALRREHLMPPIREYGLRAVVDVVGLHRHAAIQGARSRQGHSMRVTCITLRAPADGHDRADNAVRGEDTGQGAGRCGNVQIFDQNRLLVLRNMRVAA